MSVCGKGVQQISQMLLAHELAMTEYNAYRVYSMSSGTKVRNKVGLFSPAGCAMHIACSATGLLVVLACLLDANMMWQI